MYLLVFRPIHPWIHAFPYLASCADTSIIRQYAQATVRDPRRILRRLRAILLSRGPKAEETSPASTSIVTRRPDATLDPESTQRR